MVIVLVLICVFSLETPSFAHDHSNDGRTEETTDGTPPEMRWEPKWRQPSDCGVTSLYVLMRLLGHNISIEEVIDSVPVDRRSGCSLELLSASSSKLGFPAVVQFVNPESLSSMPFPLIVHSTGSLKTGVGHYRLVVAYSPKKKQYAIINVDSEIFGWVPEETVLHGYSGYVLVPKQNLVNQDRRLAGYLLIEISVLSGATAYYFWRRRSRKKAIE